MAQKVKLQKGNSNIDTRDENKIFNRSGNLKTHISR